MPAGFTKMLADRLNDLCPMQVKEAKNGDPLKRGVALIAPADYHMEIQRRSGRLVVKCYVGERIHGVMPAADILFSSVAKVAKSEAVGVILTGMGADGAMGLLKMHEAGAATIGQDRSSSVVYGMPKIARELGALDYSLPLPQIAAKIESLL
jgi:two-component system chemotaxis response regulator CheB